MFIANKKSLMAKRAKEDNFPYKCTRCGKTRTNPQGNFYMSKTSPLFVSNESYSCICSECANDLFDEYKMRYNDAKLALVITCQYLDVYFSEELFESVRDNANFSLGNYLKLINGKQYKAKNFTSFMVNAIKKGNVFKDSQEIRENKEVRWKASDLKNKNYVIQAVGYDCFEDESYTDENRKFLFNTLADYLTDDVLDDPHKLQCVIAMVKTTLQVENIDKMMNAELRQRIPDSILLDKLSGVKDKLSRSINAAANENGISAKSSGKGGKNSNSLTNIMREMSENNFEQIKINVVDTKLSESYQEIAKANAKALFNELNFTSDEYARQVAEQSVMIEDYQKALMILEENLRKLKVENKELARKLGEE